jgi:3-deoxy-manno-octulosonate cytidylyltransferase (CMP-KDO synthetase)
MVHCIIPARFASSRFPGKLLAQLGTGTVLNSTYSKAVGSKIFDSVIVAAGDQTIFDFCMEREIECIKAFNEFPNGSERVIWAATELKLSGPVVNVQADQPLFNHLDLRRLTEVGLLTDSLATLLHPISKNQLNPLVKPVYATTNREHKILTFSRLNIPSGHSEIDFLLHIGIYYFPENFWKNALNMNAFHNCKWSRTENLEQLNLLCSGLEITGVEAHDFPPEINTLEDLHLANTFIEKANHG